MIVTIANFKGGSGKTTTAIHIAAFMQTLGPTILADGDIVCASSKWAARGDAKGLPFKVVPIGQLAREALDRRYEHTVNHPRWAHEITEAVAWITPAKSE